MVVCMLLCLLQIYTLSKRVLTGGCALVLSLSLTLSLSNLCLYLYLSLAPSVSSLALSISVYVAVCLYVCLSLSLSPSLSLSLSLTHTLSLAVSLLSLCWTWLSTTLLWYIHVWCMSLRTRRGLSSNQISVVPDGAFDLLTKLTYLWVLPFVCVFWCLFPNISTNNYWICGCTAPVVTRLSHDGSCNTV